MPRGHSAAPKPKGLVVAPPRPTSPTLHQCFLPSGDTLVPYHSGPPTWWWPTLASLPTFPTAFLSFLRRLFIPRGQLPPDYMTFQALDSVQGLCSYLRSGITMHATLTGLGLDSGSASTLAAITTYLLKDGVSHLSSLAFAFGFSSQLDGEVRFWRLAADVANDCGLTLELAAPLAGPSGFLPLTCLANAFKAVCGVAAGATRVAISSHFARGVSGGAHVAEVAAKEGTQETAVTLCGILLALILSPYFNASPAIQWLAFSALTAIHVLANAAAVRCLALTTLSRTRALLLVELGGGLEGGEEEEKGGKGSTASASNSLPSPVAMRAMEPLWPVQYRGFWGGGGRGGGEGGRLRLGCSLEALQGCSGGGEAWMSNCVVFSQGSAHTLKEVMQQQGQQGEGEEAGVMAIGSDFFILGSSPTQGYCCVGYSMGVTPRTMLLGWLWGVAVLQGKEVTSGGLLKVLEGWRQAGWDTDGVSALQEEGFRVALERHS